MAATHWRSIRVRFQKDGIDNPMTLTSLHALLDYIEAVVEEALVSDAKKPEDAKRKRDRFRDSLYAPTSADAKKLNGDGYQPPPAGFETPQAVESSFDGFASMFG